MGLRNVTAAQDELSTLDQWSHKITTLATLAARIIFLVLRLFSMKQHTNKSFTIIEIVGFIMEVGRACDLSLVQTYHGRPHSRSRYSVFRTLFPMLRNFHHVYSDALEFVGFGEVARVVVSAPTTPRKARAVRPTTSMSMPEKSTSFGEFGTLAEPETVAVKQDEAPVVSQIDRQESIPIPLKWKIGEKTLEEHPCWTFEPQEILDDPRHLAHDAEIETIGELIVDLESNDPVDRDEGANGTVLPVMQSHHTEDGVETVLSTTVVPDEQIVQGHTLQPLQECHVSSRHSIDAIDQCSKREYARRSLGTRPKRPKPQRRCCSWPFGWS